jgi:hypothetical protein
MTGSEMVTATDIFMMNLSRLVNISAVFDGLPDTFRYTRSHCKMSPIARLLPENGFAARSFVTKIETFLIACPSRFCQVQKVIFESDLTLAESKAVIVIGPFVNGFLSSFASRAKEEKDTTFTWLINKSSAEERGSQERHSTNCNHQLS